MPKILFIDSSGRKYETDSSPGRTLMEAALQNGVPGIDAECGGACACATCQVYVDDSWLDKLPPVAYMENGMLDFAYERRGNSRLSCQIRITSDMDGLILHIPGRQS